MELLIPISFLKNLLPLLAIIAGIFVITTKNAIISVFNLIVLYILVAFYLIYIGINYLGLSYIIIYIGAIAILFLFIIMMIDVEVVEKRNNNYLPLLFFLLGGFLLTLKKMFYYIGLIKIKSLSFNEEKVFIHDISSFLDSYNFSTDNNKDKNIKFKESEINDIFSIWFDKSNEKLFEINISPNIHIINTIDKLDNSFFYYPNYSTNINNNYLLILPNWDSAVNRITQITAVGDILYTVYHSYIYILSIILLLSMVGAIILTADTYHEIRIINLVKNKKNSLVESFLFLLEYFFSLYYKKYNYFSSFFSKKNFKNNYILPFFYIDINTDFLHFEGLTGNLMYFIIANIILGLLLLIINSYFSLSIKYLDKEGGFECGFTSFVQTRERFNVIFYRVSLLFLIFDLEIILAFPYTAILQKNQNISKNNILAFLYILIIGFIYELKEGALNIVKKPHLTEININS